MSVWFQQVVGHRLDPVKIVDLNTKEVLWDVDAHTKFEFEWARQWFDVTALPSAAVKVVLCACSRMHASLGTCFHSSSMTPLEQVTLDSEVTSQLGQPLQRTIPACLHSRALPVDSKWSIPAF